MDSEVCDAVRFGVNPLVVMVTFWEFVETGREIVETVERNWVKVIEGRRKVGGRRTQHVFEVGDSVAVWRENKKLGALRVDAHISCDVV